jgi:putative hydrolase of the HAD superfamily
LAKAFKDFKYLTFDVVGTLIDFEGGLKGCLTEIGARSWYRPMDGEAALTLYRQARYMPECRPVSGRSCPGLPADRAGARPATERGYGERLRDSAKTWKGLSDSAEPWRALPNAIA